MPVKLHSTVQQANYNGLTFYKVRNQHCEGEICLQGAHISHFQPEQEAPVLWMSEQSSFKPGLPLRGGIPVCFPWFGKGPDGNMEPMHGPVRIENWTLEKCQQTLSGETVLIFTKADSDMFSLRYSVTFGKKLTTKIEIRNPNPTRTSSYELMLHNYFNVWHIEDTLIRGLEGLRFANRVNNTDSDPENEPIGFITDDRIERIYTTGRRITIHDPGNKRNIHIDCDGGSSICVWNPGQDVAALSDIGQDDWQNFVCVERGGAESKSIILKPNGIAFISQVIFCEPL